MRPIYEPPHGLRPFLWITDGCDTKRTIHRAEFKADIGLAQREPILAAVPSSKLVMTYFFWAQIGLSEERQWAIGVLRSNPSHRYLSKPVDELPTALGSQLRRLRDDPSISCTFVLGWIAKRRGLGHPTAHISIRTLTARGDQ
jgi:hypothetical protein